MKFYIFYTGTPRRDHIIVATKILKIWSKQIGKGFKIIYKNSTFPPFDVLVGCQLQAYIVRKCGLCDDLKLGTIRISFITIA